MARAQRKLEVVITGDSRQLEGAFRRSAGASDTFGKKLTRGAGKGLAVVGKAGALAAVAVGVGFAAAMKHGISGAMDHQKVMAQTEAVLKSTNNAVNTSTKAIEENAAALEMKTGIDGDVIQSGMNLMATFGKVRNEVGRNNDIFDQANQTALDMSVTFGTSLQSSSIQLGKALQDPIKGVSALTRVGVSFSEQQKDQISALVESGRTLDAQKLILAEVNKQVGGSAEAYGRTLPGQIERAKRSFDALTEAIAGPLMPLLGDLVEGLLGVFQNPAVQAGLQSFARDLTTTLQQVVAWFRENWPTIRTIVMGVFTAIKFAVQNIIVPAAKAIIIGIGAAVNFIRQNMPAIRATFQAVFGWIETNIVPTVRFIADAIQKAVGDMTKFWRDHGDTIKAILRPIYNTIRDIITSALIIIREVVEANLALIRGDWSAVWDSIKTIVGAALRGVTAVIRNIGGAILSAAADLGMRLIDGIITGLSNGTNRLKAKLEQMLRDIVNRLNPFSPVEHGGVIIANRLTDGMISQLEARRTKVAAGLTKVIREAVMDARGNLAGLTSGLAGMLSAIYGESSADAKRAREIRQQQQETERQRERIRLQAAIDEAETDEERAQARQDLADWELDQEAQRLEESVANQQSAYERNIANLTAEFNNGAISAQKFRDDLTALIGGATGQELGVAFATEFGAQLGSIADQIAALVGLPTGVAPPGVVSPAQTQRELIQQWNQRRDQRLDELTQRYRAADSDGGTKITAAEQKLINKAMAKWRSKNPKPKALAMGGVLRSAVLAGEAGPEAVLPLSSGRARRMLAEAMDAADQINGRGGGTTVVHVTVNGNEFSAAEFARKLAPELRRQVALTRSV